MAKSKPNRVNKKKRVKLDAFVSQGLQLERLGQMGQAVEIYLKVLASDSGHPVACQALGNIYYRQGQHTEAEPLLRNALRENKDSGRLQCVYADCLRLLGRAEESLNYYQRAIRLSPELHSAHLNLAGVYRVLRRMEEAIDSYTRALEAGASPAAAHGGLGHCYRYIGNFKRAVEHFQQVLRADPENADALYQLAQLTNQAGDDNLVDAMEALAEHSAGDDKILMCFALAKAYDDRGDSAKSFSWLEQGNRLKRDSFDYDPQKTAELFSAIRSSYAAPLPEAGIDTDGFTPIFIVGMPRSGTSLVEQILASHSQVFGAGELDLLNSIASELERQTQTVYPQAIYAASADQLREHASGYLQAMNRLSGGAAYVTDKMPQNFRHLGLIEKLFAGNARIIHCERDPMAICWSIYRQLFQGEHPYAYSQQDLGEYYHQYQQLMTFWLSVLGDKIYTVSYERLVADIESEVPALLNWLGLEMEPACLEFHKTERAVTTASVAQVRQPVYQHALKGWRRYEEYLSELKQAVEAKSQ